MAASALNLETIIDGGIEVATRLDALLGHERAALEAQDAESLDALAAEKLACLEQLEALESRRAALLNEHGLGNDHAGMQTLLENTGSASAWQEYLLLARRCHTGNQTNGAIIRLRHHQLSSALSVISGERLSTYGPSGNRPPLQARELGRA